MRASFKLIVLTATLAAVGALAYTKSEPEKPAAFNAAAPRKPAAPRDAAPSPAAHAPAGASLPERGALAESTSPLFSSQTWEPPPPKVKAGPPSPPPKAVAPALPFRFAGRMLQDGTVFVFLARGDSVITAKQGDVIDGVYRVESVSESEVTLIYTPLKEKQSLAVVSSLPQALAPPFGDVRVAPAAPRRADAAPPSPIR